MVNEMLSIPEEHLRDVIKVIKSGLSSVEVSDDVSNNLEHWCDEQEEYLNELD